MTGRKAFRTQPLLGKDRIVSKRLEKSTDLAKEGTRLWSQLLNKHKHAGYHVCGTLTGAPIAQAAMTFLHFFSTSGAVAAVQGPPYVGTWFDLERIH